MLFRYRSRNTETQSRSSDVAYRICGIAAPWHYGPVALWHCDLYPLSLCQNAFPYSCPLTSPAVRRVWVRDSDSSQFRHFNVPTFKNPTLRHSDKFCRNNDTGFFFCFFFGELSLILSKSTAIPTNSNVSIFRQNCHLTVCLSLSEC